MKINALMMDKTDNVVTCVADIAAGETVCYRNGEEVCTLVAKEAVPYCHKIAIKDVEEGGEIIKYGESLGKTSEEIKTGYWVSHKNLFSVPRDYDAEMVELA